MMNAWRILRRLALPLAAFFMALEVRADAPADQYNPYVRADVEIGDAKTRLSWRRSVLPALTYAQAIVTTAHCPDDIPNNIIYRLPTVKELLTLVDELPHTEYENGSLIAKSIDRSAFPSTPAAEFWSGSEYVTVGTDQAWVVDFATGAAHPRPKTEAHFVRCVRD